MNIHKGFKHFHHATFLFFLSTSIASKDSSGVHCVEYQRKKSVARKDVRSRANHATKPHVLLTNFQKLVYQTRNKL